MDDALGGIAPVPTTVLWHRSALAVMPVSEWYNRDVAANWSPQERIPGWAFGDLMESNARAAKAAATTCPTLRPAIGRYSPFTPTATPWRVTARAHAG